MGSSWFGNRVQGSWCGCFSTLGPIRSLKIYSTRGRVRIPVVCSPEAPVYACREGLRSSGVHGLKIRFYPDDGQVRRFPVTPYIFAALAHRRSCLPSSESVSPAISMSPNLTSFHFVEPFIHLLITPCIEKCTFPLNAWPCTGGSGKLSK